MKTLLTIIFLLFTTISNANDTVLVYFGAEWCGPCKTFSQNFSDPLVDSWIKYGRISVVRIDVEERPDIVAEWGMEGQSIPQGIFVTTDWNESKEITRFRGDIGRNKFINLIRGIVK